MVEDVPVAVYYGERVLIHEESSANQIHQNGATGKPLSGGRLQLSPIEALYLLDRDKVRLLNERGDEMNFEELSSELVDRDADLLLKYKAYDDLRSRGLVVKTGLKYGAHFRVYERGDTPGSNHSPYLIHAISENSKLTPQYLARSVRLAHSVRKKMIFAVVDDEGDVTYYSLLRESL